jgi:hypothetical protein
MAAVALLASCAATGGKTPPAGVASPPPAATAAPTRCVYNRPANATDDPCKPRPPDGPPRAALTNAEKASAEPVRRAVEHAITSAVSCPPGGCTPSDLARISDDIRTALTAAGFPDSIVRPARPGDPAPTDSVVYAAPAGPACLLGYYQPSTTQNRVQVDGPLAQGGCL